MHYSPWQISVTPAPAQIILSDILPAPMASRHTWLLTATTVAFLSTGTRPIPTDSRDPHPITSLETAFSKLSTEFRFLVVYVIFLPYLYLGSKLARSCSFYKADLLA